MLPQLGLKLPFQVKPLMLTDSEIQKKIKNIAVEVEKVKAESGLNYIESTVVVCEKFNLEIEEMRRALPKAIKEKIEADALELNMLKYKVQRVV